MKEIKLKGLDETVYYDECENGLKIYMWVNERVEATFMSLAIKYGSVHTEFEIDKVKHKVPRGVAHFLEHVKFNESKDTTAHDFYYKTGADVNAFTTFDYTCYHVYALNKVEENLNHLLDFVQNRFFTKPLIDKEKGIIVEEAKMGEDRGDVHNYFGVFRSLFKNSKYKDLITGEVEDIKNTTLEDIELAFDAFYHPKNMCLFITGNFNPYELSGIVKENQSMKEFDSYKNPKVLIPKEPLKVVEEYTEVEGNVSIPKTKYALKIPKSTFKGYTDLEIKVYINLILKSNFGSTSDFKEFVETNKLATSIYPIFDVYDDYVCIIITFESRFYNEMAKLVEEKLEKLELDEKTFNRKKKVQIATTIIEYDDIETVSDIMQNEYISFGEVLGDLKQQYENLSHKKAKDILSKINSTNKSIYVIKPKKQPK